MSSQSSETPRADNRGSQIDADLLARLQAQRSDFVRRGAPSVAVRRDRIDRLILMLTEKADAFSEALHIDFGNRPHLVNLLSDVAGILPDLAYTRRCLRAWMRSDHLFVRGTLIGLPTIIEKRPLGVVGIIGPWNFPVSLVVQPAASAFAAGNRVMIKLSEIPSRTAEVFAAAVTEYFDVKELTAVTGGPDVGAAFGALPFDHLFFTGSTGVGERVAQTAGKNLVPVTLELGGKNPAVVAHDADIAAAAKRIMLARLANGGQLCLCPDYAFVPHRAVAEFVEAAMRWAKDAANAEGGAGLVSIVDDKNYRRLSDIITDARNQGATVRQIELEADPVRRRIPPTILLDVTDSMIATQQELFGPVLVVFPYDSVEEVTTYINARPSPLAAYWHGKPDAEFDRFREHVCCGGMTVNDFALHCAMIGPPFGGVGRSGFGAYHGKAGFDAFTHRRTVTISRLPFSLAGVLAPPYSVALKAAVSQYLALHRWRAGRRVAKFAARTNDRG